MMRFYVTKTFTFDSAHYLEEYKGKCEELHGHTYKLEVTVCGQRDSSGLVLDFGIIKKIVNEKIIDRLDHKLLNQVLDFNPSAENIVAWIWKELQDDLKGENYFLYSIRLWESPTSFVEVKEE